MKPATATVFAFLSMVLLATPAVAGEGRQGDIRIADAWARATPGAAQAGGAFLTLSNSGAADDALVSAASPVAGTVELHTHVHEGAVMRMRAVPSIPVPAGKTVALQPGGLHVMLIGLRQPLAQGTRFPLTLTFEKAGTTTVEVDVLDVGAMGPGMTDHMQHMQHMQHMHDGGAQ